MSAAGEVLELAPFGEELDRLRQAHGVSFRQLAAAAGVDAGYLCHLVKGRRGHRASDTLIERVAGALGVAPDDFQEYRQRRALELYPELVDELYRRAKAS